MKLFYYVLFIQILLNSCNSMDNPFFLDTKHLDNLEINEEKLKVYKIFIDFSDWYTTQNNGLSFYEGAWGMSGNNHSVNDDVRKDYLLKSILPAIDNCTLLSTEYKNKIDYNIECLNDLGNLGNILLNDGDCEQFGLGVELASFFNENSFYTAPVKEQLKLDTRNIFEEPEEVLKVFLNLIYIDDSKAIVSLPLYCINNYDANNIIKLELLKKENEWVINSIYSEYIKSDDIWYDYD